MATDNGDIFDLTMRPADDLVPPRKDPLDTTMGEAIMRDFVDYDRAEFVLVGCPQDIGVRRNKGRAGAAGAPPEIRRALYKFPAQGGLLDSKVFDLGDIIILDSLEDTHQRQRDIVRRLLQDQKKVIVLGGGNDISYPDVAALADSVEDILAFNIDTHFDVRESEYRHSGTPYRQLLEGQYVHAPQFYQMASKPIANSPAYEKYLREQGVHIYPLEELRRRGLDDLFEEILSGAKADAVFWGFDIDAVKSVDAPGVSAPYPIGLSAEEICRIAQIAGAERRTRIIEVSEVNPRYDVDGRTARLVAMMLLYYLRAAVE